MGEPEGQSGIALSSVPQSPSGGAGILGYLGRHPILMLLLLSPGIPEYLSGSSAWSAVILNPGLFVFQIAANLGLYGPGVVLIREAKVRWHKGWGTVLSLGAAYGILEEGVALSTLFDPKSNNAGVLGTFGHWLGVSWVWASGVLLVHMVYSIALPILLVGLAFPETRARSLLSNRGIGVAFAILGADVFLLALFVVRSIHFWMGTPVLVGSFIAIGALVYLAHKAPATWPSRKQSSPRRGIRFTFLAGIAVYPGVILVQAFSGRLDEPILTILLVLGWEYLSLRWVLSNLNFAGNERRLTAFTFGLLIPLFVSGLIVNFPLELVLIEDIGLILFFGYLFRIYPSGRTEAGEASARSPVALAQPPGTGIINAPSSPSAANPLPTRMTWLPRTLRFQVASSMNSESRHIPS
jgi:hypothetical protein